MLEFDWDEGKRQSNLQKHGVDFEDITPIFETDSVQWIDNRKNYGEERVNVLGEVEGDIFFVTYTKRNTKYRLISARRANSRERRKYYQSLLGRMETDEG
ncbi:MAG: BrnT family toxin [Halothece sp. Uz-M2-17]|nr:BrnT family toxin [Halothece sp. Uz-M2-17]